MGTGAFAWVYEAVDLDLEIPVALKVLRPEYAGQPAAEARFRREATTAARLRHPNIVFIRDVGEGEGTVFVAMDLLPLSLARRLEVLPRLPEAEVVRFALEVAAALSIAHADGVVHRDIKPDNVMLGANGEAIVADFGLAGAFTNDPDRNDPSVSDPGKVMGTPHYFSPEQARGLEVDGRSDLYSLGVMCYRAAAGRLPFEGDDWYTVARQHVEDAPVCPRAIVPELTEGFEAIVLRLLSKQPDHRFLSATQLVDALLVLPTAPASRSVGLTPASASITQVAFPYVHFGVPKGARRWRRALLAGTLAIVAVAGFVYFGVPAIRASGNQLASADTVNRVPLPLSGDSVTATAFDSTRTGENGEKTVAAVAKPPSKPTPAVRTPAVPSRVHVFVHAADSARLLVDDQLVGRGSWEGDLLAGRQHRFRARLDGTVRGCRSAEYDAVATFAAGQPATIELDVAPCSVFLLTVRSSDAEFTVTAKDSSYQRKFRYLGTPTPIVLRNGMYDVVVRADKCSDYTFPDLIIGPSVQQAADTVKRLAVMNCGPELKGFRR